MKRVLIFSLAYVPYVGGAELAIKEITDRLDTSEYSFDMVTLRFDRRLPAIEKIGNVTVHRIGFTAQNVKVSDRALPWQCRLAKSLFPFTSFLKARSLHKDIRFDLIWAMMANQAGFGALFFSASLKLRRTGKYVPYFLELQDGNSLEQIQARRPIVSLLWPLYKRVYFKADAIKAISQFIARLAREVGYHGKVEVIPNAVDVAKFSVPIPEDETAGLKEKLGKKMGDVFLFTASRLVLSRGVEEVIRALPQLPSNVKFLVAGDGEDRAKLEAIAKEAHVRDRVIFAGHVAHADIPKYLKVSDIFVRPSIIEGMGSAFVEAFAAGIPVVATPVGGIPDFLFDPDRDKDMEPTGLFCEVRNPESIAHAVKKYMENPTLAARIIKNAKALAEEKYDWNLIAEAMKKQIFDPLSQRG
ncbi:glycosyltransferase family 4 protein [Candidatus Kaiserbacteria bacterium]|nr:glycosyltransferase family 4 protein [Candidatus Kaiserbacteria bacterium]